MMAGRANKRSNVGRVLFRRSRDCRASKMLLQATPEVERLRHRLAPGRRTIQF